MSSAPPHVPPAEPIDRASVPITVMIFTFNEEIHLASCLASLRWAGDVLVVDSFSTDGTERIARAHGARFVQHAFVGFGSQRNWAIDHAAPSHDWVLMLDADERVPAELAAEMARAVSAPGSQVGAYRVKRRLFMWGRWLRYSSMYPNWVVRLVHRNRVRYVDRGHAETQTVDGEVRELQHDLIDENLRSIEEWFARQNRYAGKEAAYELAEEGNEAGWSQLIGGDPLARRAALKRLASRIPCRSLVYFLYSYVIRRGFLDGRDGYVFCRMKALYQGMITVRKYDARRRAGV